MVIIGGPQNLASGDNVLLFGDDHATTRMPREKLDVVGCAETCAPGAVWFSGLIGVSDPVAETGAPDCDIRRRFGASPRSLPSIQPLADGYYIAHAAPVAWRHARPAPERVVEAAHLAVAEHVGELGELHVRLLQHLLGDLAAHSVHGSLEGSASRRQQAVHGAPMLGKQLGHPVRRAVAGWQERADHSAELGDEIAGMAGLDARHVFMQDLA